MSIQPGFTNENAVYNAVLHEKQLALINERLRELKQKYPVSVNEEVLAGIELTESKKANDITLFARKKFSWEPLVPGLDMKWFHLN
jgi:hypothetical protein